MSEPKRKTTLVGRPDLHLDGLLQFSVKSLIKSVQFKALGIAKGGLRLNDDLIIARKLLMTVMTRKQDLEDRDMGRSSSFNYWIQGGRPFWMSGPGESREHFGHCRGGRSCLDK